ncbi:hypothetical protein HYC85_008116 [Camellia sinensis]|uniref:Uncharacterized protein n=1 Tax=Camellia sinensis TaxID=4442 RepID=A0A7J7HQX9_CAMSI|nr:hypothetical protein HYC85_008116 [Camellia sinensis]
MSTIFIALQCFQCSTMQANLSLSLSLSLGIRVFDRQVKQKKKSSNKWTCVVCNQKAISAEGVRSSFHGQRRPQIRPDLQHVPPIRPTTMPRRNPSSITRTFQQSASEQSQQHED